MVQPLMPSHADAFRCATASTPHCSPLFLDPRPHLHHHPRHVATPIPRSSPHKPAVHALSSTEVLYVCDDRVDRLETPTSSVSVAMDLSGRVLGAGVPVLESVQVTSMATKGRLVAAGGLAGEVVVRHLGEWTRRGSKGGGRGRQTR